MSLFKLMFRDDLDFTNAYRFRISWERRYRRTPKTVTIPLGIILTSCVLAIGAIYFVPKMSYASWHIYSSAPIGDAIGGITAPVIGVLNAVLLWWTIRVQNKETNYELRRNDVERHLESIEALVNSCRLTVIRRRAEARPSGLVTGFKNYESLLIGDEALNTATISLNAAVEGHRLQFNEIEWQIFLAKLQRILRKARASAGLMIGLTERSGLYFDDLEDLMEPVFKIGDAYIVFYKKYSESEAVNSHYCHANAYQKFLHACGDELTGLRRLLTNRKEHFEEKRLRARIGSR